MAENPLSLHESFLLANENFSIALPKNMFYRFKVVAKNVIGEVSTEYREICELNLIINVRNYA